MGLLRDCELDSWLHWTLSQALTLRLFAVAKHIVEVAIEEWEEVALLSVHP